MMQWRALVSSKRMQVLDYQKEIIRLSESEPSQDRHAFHVDYDRVVFSNAFRRLGRKTQVHPLAINDHTHNRLTHSLEVACVGRSLGNRVGAMLASGGLLAADILPSWLGNIVQVACLAHDIGNPPFGHTGEDALRNWLRQAEQAYLFQHLNAAERADIQTYEGNAHSFRIVSALEMYRYAGGMRLTAASLGALLKYPWTVPAGKIAGKFNLYQKDVFYYRAIAKELGIPEIAPQHWARHPLSYLMEAADDICYAIVDLEDALELDLISFEEFKRVLAPLVLLEDLWDKKQDAALWRGVAIGACVHDVADVFMRHHAALLAGEFSAPDLLSLADLRIREALGSAKELAQRKIYHYQAKTPTEIAAYSCLSSLVELLFLAVHQFFTEQKVSGKSFLALQLLDFPLERAHGLYQAYLEILDFIGGLTDNKAARLAKEISGGHF